MIPKIIFIVPYRNRPHHQHFFNTYIQHILEDYPANYCKVYFIEQNNQHERFNRGAVKNIGFMAMKELYPKNYKNITFVFNDVDTIPYKKNILQYETTTGIIKHFYGKRFAMGGIFSITGGDFEKIEGFSNYWTWGHEDVVIVKRAEKHKIRIDRSIYFEMGDINIIHLNNDRTRGLDISTSFLVDDDPLNTINIIMNLKYTVYDNNTIHSNFIYIDHFDLALEKRIFDYVIDYDKGKEHYLKTFGELKEQHKKKYGTGNKYVINTEIIGAKEHLLKHHFDLSLLNKNMKTNKVRNNSVARNNSVMAKMVMMPKK